MEDAAQLFELFENIKQWMDKCYGLYALLIRLKKALGINVDAIHHSTIEDMDVARQYFKYKIER